MVRILLYGYTTGVCSSRVIERKCVDDVAFRWLAAGAAPDYRAIARFRKRHLSALGYLFVRGVGVVPGRGHGPARPRRAGRDKGAGQRVKTQGDARAPCWMNVTERVLAEEVWALLADAESDR